MRVEVRTTTRTTSSTESTGSNVRTKSVSKKKKGKDPANSLDHTPRRGVFQSVLTKPFRLWNSIEDIIAEFLPEWTPSQRSCLIQNLLQFLELKVILDEHEPNKLLAPTQLVAHAWHVLILETELYRNVTFAIQDFHGRRRRMIHHALLGRTDRHVFEERLERTQRLFYSYYTSKMPTELEEIDVGNARCEPVAGKEPKTKNNLPKIDSFVVSSREEASFHSQVKDDVDEEEEEGTKEEEEEEEGEPDDRRWYLPSFGCLNIGEAFCCKEGNAAPEDDIFAIREDVSLLTPPDSLPDE